MSAPVIAEVEFIHAVMRLDERFRKWIIQVILHPSSYTQRQVRLARIILGQAL